MSKEFKLFLMILLILGAGFLSNKIIITGKFHIVEEKTDVELIVLSDPNNADVFLGGNYVGKTPITISTIPGTYDITLKKAGYYDLNEYVDIEKDQRKDVFFELESSFGRIYFESDPVNAEVFIDGVHKGITPKLISDLSDGVHTIKLVKENYIDYVNQIVVGKQEKKVFIKLEKKPKEGFASPLYFDKH